MSAQTFAETVLLTRREVHARELMDDPDCNLEALNRTYRHFPVINSLVSGWRRVYTTQLRPLLSARIDTTLLDVGCGGGDVAVALARWAKRDGLLLTITAIDPDARAFAFCSARPPVRGVTFVQTTSAALAGAGHTFDVIISNHLLHHLDDDARSALLTDCEHLARRLVVHNDIARSPVAYAAYFVATLPFMRGSRPDASFIHDDGLLSIRRSFRPAELAALAPPGWHVRAQFPFRVLLRRDVVAQSEVGHLIATEDNEETTRA